nr:MAG TPA: hypothetical protein [Caudoviricetes sp.]DAN07233.1 MAG TPA: hypothetical protein [Caudoviricetes sp.]
MYPFINNKNELAMSPFDFTRMDRVTSDTAHW